MKFFIESEKYTEFWRNPGTINVGDFFVAISKKYKDISSNNFIGNTYSQFTIMESTDLGNRTFRVKASTDKRLDFLEKGLLFCIGLTEQIITLNSSNQIESLKVVKSTSSIVGGTGDMEKYENGIYKLDTIDSHKFAATLTQKSEKYYHLFLFFFLFLFFLILFLFFLFIKR